MSLLKQVAYYLGLIAGLATVGAAGAVLLTYLFTGKLPTIKMAAPPEAGGTGGEKAKMELFTPDEIAASIRRRLDSAEVAQSSEEVGE